MAVSLPRLVVVMGSGETSPTMVKAHREIFARLDSTDGGAGGPTGPPVLLDTPFGFQENADDIAAKAVLYFRESVGRTVEVASMRAPDLDALTTETALALVRVAPWVFAGPGSPTYALRVWRGSGMPALLAEKLARGGCVTFASAAALTLGVATVPIYEIYKAGVDPAWIEGLDLLSAVGLRVALIPHYDNAEGGHHDTRFCYLGERRLARLERDLPDDTFVLGVDEHTGLILDLDAGRAEVVGRGAVTVRTADRSTTVPAGSALAIADLTAMAFDPSSTARERGDAPAAAARGLAAQANRFGEDSPPATASVGGAPDPGDEVQRRGDWPPDAEATTDPLPVASLLEASGRCQVAFDTALRERSVPGAVRAILELDDHIVAWSLDTLQSDETNQARAALRSMIVRLGQLAEVGAVDRRDVVGPYVDALLEVRSAARDAQRWADADAVRDALVALGVEVQDSPNGTTWILKQHT